MTQSQMAELLGMRQSRISAMERPGSSLNIETLVRLATALRIGLTVRFGTFSDMIQWENDFSQDDFEVAKLEEDIEFVKEQPTAPEEKAVAGWAAKPFNFQAPPLLATVIPAPSFGGLPAMQIVQTAASLTLGLVDQASLVGEIVQGTVETQQYKVVNG
jgi:transcriptional regulator with XRE-family HTH domain